MDDLDHREEAGAAAPAAPMTPPVQDAIRTAYLARNTAPPPIAATAQNEAQDGAAVVRGAYLRHLTQVRTEAVAGETRAEDAMLRSVYAARSAVVVIAPPARAPRKAKAAPRRARPAAKPKAAAKAGAATPRAKAKKAKRASPAAKAARPAKRAAGRAMASRRTARKR